MRERKLNRLQGADYSKNGYYFVTIRVDRGRKCLGDVLKDEVYLTSRGKIVDESWFWMIGSFSYVFSRAFLIMPNHLHAIVLLYDRKADASTKIKPLHQLIGMFKSRSSKRIHQAGYSDFRWQRSFHERIIRNSREYRAIKEYIRKNPEKWKDH